MFNATVFNIDPQHIESRLQDAGFISLQSYISFIKRFDMIKGRKFIPPIHKSPKFEPLFDEIFHMTLLGISLQTQNIYLILKKENGNSSVILKSPYKETLTIPIEVDQIEDMVKVLQTGGFTQIDSLTKTTTIFQHPFSHVHCSLSMMNTLKPFLHVESEQEEDIIETLALLHITVNRAILNTPINNSLREYFKGDVELLRLL